MTESSPFPILSMRRLESLLGRPRKDLRRIAEAAPRFYLPFRLKNGRVIDRPMGELKVVQGLIQDRLLSKVQLPDSMYGGVKGRSPKQNALLHLGAPVLVTVDLKQCFPRTPNSAIYRVFKETLGCSTDVSHLLTRLTTNMGHVPQGAPTSTTLCNLALLPLNHQVASVADALCLRFSQYIDDFALSGRRAREAVGPLVEAAQAHGYPIRCRKKKVMSSGKRQVVTGITVNTKLALPRDRYESIRLEITTSAKMGRLSEKALARLRGRIAHAKYINAKQGDTLAKFAARAIKGW